jgi:cellulose synthase/poly-beta-1,6-N-acetylglucosamine synthase-like glycosyltransferase
MAEIVFWVSVLLLAWIYAGFGLIAGVWGLVRRRKVAAAPCTPSVSLIIAAYNEELGIRDKIRNSLALDYPADALEIIVGSDGSDDATESIVAEYGSRGVVLRAFPRRGKIHVLDELVGDARGEVLVFSDANTLYDPQAVRMLVRNFADPEVGGVCGNQEYRKTEGGDSSGQGESSYWKYDKWLKSLQSETGSIVSADGAMYAIRRPLYRKPPSAAVTDDFAISTGVIAAGKRLVFEGEAIGYEYPTGRAPDEFGRRVRLMNRGLNGVWLRRGLLNPFRFGFYSVILFSHKVLRRLAPILLLSLFVSSLALVSTGPLYFVIAAGQIACYLLAGAGFLLKASPAGRHRLLSTPFYFCLANAAALVALITFLGGRRIEHWNPKRQRDPVASAGRPAH